MEERFYYEVGCSAPLLGPGRYIKVEFIGESGTFRCFGNEFVDGGMGTGYSGVCRDASVKYKLPKAIEATWVSFTDRKVYRFASLIPYDTILELFRDGGAPCDPTSDDRTEKIKSLDLCFLPGGKAQLYIKAPVKRILLDWSVTGEEVTDDEILSDVYAAWGLKSMDKYYDEFYSNRFSDLEYWRTYMSEHGSAAPLLERYLERFNYTLEFEFEDETASVDKLGADFTNAEYYSLTPRFSEAFKTPSRIMEFFVEWRDSNYEYQGYMYFNEPEMLRAFDEAFGDDRMQKGELRIKVNKENNQYDIFLNVGEKSIKLEKTEIRAFRDPKGGPYDGELIYKNYKGNHKNYFADYLRYFEQ